jgi:hypothetical protein
MVNFRNLSKLADKAKDLAGQHGDKIDQAIDRSVQAADKATKGKYGDRLAGGADKLKGAVAGAADKPARAGGVTPIADTTAGTGPGPAAKPAGDVAPAPAPVVNADGSPTPDPDAPKGAA